MTTRTRSSRSAARCGRVSGAQSRMHQPSSSHDRRLRASRWGVTSPGVPAPPGPVPVTSTGMGRTPIELRRDLGAAARLWSAPAHNTVEPEWWTAFSGELSVTYNVACCQSSDNDVLVDHCLQRRPLVDLRRDQRRRPGRSGKERPRRFRFGQAARAHYARNKLLGLLPLIISVVWRRESRRRSRSSGTRSWGLPSARRTIGCGRSGPTWAGIPSRQSPATEQGAETIPVPAPGAGGSESRPLPG